MAAQAVAVRRHKERNAAAGQEESTDEEYSVTDDDHSIASDDRYTQFRGGDNRRSQDGRRHSQNHVVTLKKRQKQSAMKIAAWYKSSKHLRKWHASVGMMQVRALSKAAGR